MNELAQKLQQGLSVNNLRALVDRCRALSQESNDRVALYVLESVFADILRDWDERALSPQEVEKAEEAIVNPSLRLLECLRGNRPLEAEMKILEELVSNFVSL